VTTDAFSQSAKKIKKDLVNTWYAINVGEPEGGEMRPTKRKEVFIFNSDGTLIIKDGEMEIPGKWEYLGDSKLKAGISFQGMEREVEISIRELTSDKLVLVDPDRATEYSTTPPDPNAPKPRTAPLVVGSDSNYDVDQWTGLHPFNKKLITSVDGSQEKVDAVGVIVLLMINGEKTLRVNDDGLTTDIVVSGGSEIAGQKHFGFVTDDPELAGEIVFNGNENFYIYRDKDQSTIEYIKE
jgi:hypothetical protein